MTGKPFVLTIFPEFIRIDGDDVRTEQFSERAIIFVSGVSFHVSRVSFYVWRLAFRVPTSAKMILNILAARSGAPPDRRRFSVARFIRVDVNTISRKAALINSRPETRNTELGTPNVERLLTSP